MRFLIVDDLADSREAVRSVLECRGHTVVAEAATGEEALAATDRFGPDAVLLDLRLGDESCLDVARALTAAWPRLPVLVFSLSTGVTSELVRAYGARGFVAKDRLHEVDLAAILKGEGAP
jgi:DNA-binding NarL/FixJ family response regulator